MGADYYIRKASIGDMWEIYDLVNDLFVRLASINKKTITRKEHEEWFKTKLSDTNCYFYVVCNMQGTVIGSVRLDKEEQKSTYDISIYLDPDYQGRGLGTEVIAEVTTKLQKEHNNCDIQAYIALNNIASQRAFGKAGYQEIETKIINGRHYIVMQT